MQEIQNVYLQLLLNFPPNLRPIVSIALAVLVIYSIFKVVKKDFLWIIVLIILLPGSLTILKTIWEGVLVFIKFLLNIK